MYIRVDTYSYGNCEAEVTNSKNWIVQAGDKKRVGWGKQDGGTMAAPSANLFSKKVNTEFSLVLTCAINDPILVHFLIFRSRRRVWICMLICFLYFVNWLSVLKYCVGHQTERHWFCQSDTSTSFLCNMSNYDCL